MIQITFTNFLPPEHLFASMSIAALALLFVSFLFAIKLKNMMGAGKDTGPVKILMAVIVTNAILGFYSATSIYWKYVHDYVTYVRLTDIILLIISIILVVSIYKVYKDYTQIIQKNEPNA